MEKINYRSVDEYIATFPQNVRELLEEIRFAIKQAAPKAEEVISYNMPAYKMNTVLVYFAGYKGHIGFYPTASPMIVFKEELSKYKTSKGAVQFPLDKSIPKTLVKNMVKYRIKEDAERAKAKKEKKK